MIIKKKKCTDEQQNEFVLLNVKCDNCGASLKYKKEDLSCVCDYCRTEYYISEEGKFEGQIIKLKIHGEEKKFYIGEEKYCRICFGAHRNIEGKLVQNYITTKMKIKLIEM